MTGVVLDRYERAFHPRPLGDLLPLQVGRLRDLTHRVLLGGVEGHRQHVEHGRYIVAEVYGGALLVALGADLDVLDVEPEREHLDHRDEPLDAFLAVRLVSPVGRVRGADALPELFLGDLLVVEVERRIDLVAVGVDIRGAEQELVLQAVTHVLGEPGSGIALQSLEERGGVRAARIVVIGPVLLEARIGLFLRRVAELDHLVEDLALQSARVFRIRDGRVGEVSGARQLEDEQDRFGDGELGGAVAEVEPARRLDPVRPVAEGHTVEVLLEDLVLRQVSFELQRPPELSELPSDRHALVGIHHLRELLRHRARTGEVAGSPSGDVVEREVERRARHPPEVEPVVLEVRSVLARDERVDHVPWELLNGDEGTFLVTKELGDLCAVPVDEHGRQRRLGLGGSRDLPDVVDGRDRHANGDPHRESDEHREAYKNQQHHTVPAVESHSNRLRSRTAHVNLPGESVRGEKKAGTRRCRPTVRSSVIHIVNWEGNYNEQPTP